MLEEGNVKKESLQERIDRKLVKKRKNISVALGKQKADIVFNNATYLNVFSNEWIKGDIAVSNGLIVGLGQYNGVKEIDVTGKIIIPGLIDSHIHLESSLCSPCEFAKAVVRHGTTTVIADPHEIANVMGCDGIDYMIEATEGLPIDVHFMLPSCVPASEVEESGANLSYREIDKYYDHPRVLGLAEMMNYVGVINGEESAISKILASQSHHKKIDGHAPSLSGNALNAYITAGVYSDHECDTLENALEKLKKGQFIMIREGTAAKNLKALLPLLNNQYYSRCLFCTDDKHPNDLLNKGHIDSSIQYSIKNGVDPVIAVKVPTYNAARYFLLNNKGAIAPGYIADLVIIDNVKDFNVLSVYKKGSLVFDGKDVINFKNPTINGNLINHAYNTFNTKKIDKNSFKINKPIPSIKMIGGEIVTDIGSVEDCINVGHDVLKIVAVERHKGTGNIGCGYINGYGLKKGAIATSISHDSHNIIAVGTNDKDIAFAVNEIINMHGGICVVDNNVVVAELPLPLAGIISDKNLYEIDLLLNKTKQAAYLQGVNKNIDPFMSLSFMSLSVIPKLRLTTKGVFDVEKWKTI